MRGVRPWGEPPAPLAASPVPFSQRRKEAKQISANFASLRETLEVLNDEVEHHLPHVLQQQRIRDAVPRLRIQHQLKLLPRLLQLVNKLYGVLHVHVVINRAVNQ